MRAVANGTRVSCLFLSPRCHSLSILRSRFGVGRRCVAFSTPRDAVAQLHGQGLIPVEVRASGLLGTRRRRIHVQLVANALQQMAQMLNIGGVPLAQVFPGMTEEQEQPALRSVLERLKHSQDEVDRGHRVISCKARMDQLVRVRTGPVRTAVAARRLAAASCRSRAPHIRCGLAGRPAAALPVGRLQDGVFGEFLARRPRNSLLQESWVRLAGRRPRNSRRGRGKAGGNVCRSVKGGAAVTASGMHHGVRLRAWYAF